MMRIKPVYTMKRNHYFRFVYLILCIFQLTFSQEKSISITIDDVPNTVKYKKDHFEPVLLNMLDSLNVPFTIFINESKIYQTRSKEKNKKLLEKWIKNDLTILGNHTYNHSRYSDIGLEKFVQDIKRGEKLTKPLASTYGKKLTYFRFPFNDVGKDSVQHAQIKRTLKSKNYVLSPFTVESSDWMFNSVYRHYLDQGQIARAKVVGERYVKQTLKLVDFFEKMGYVIYKRPIKHIYLCHDNAINADYLDDIIKALKQKEYKIISFSESLKDPIYKQQDVYYKKWGISWLYRWMQTRKERLKWMKKEPLLTEIQNTYNEIQKKQSRTRN